uniref:Major facilitator superfamily (MFS) profile domain-containing protein n=2 Tax=Stomoxys calcitrans TaxID=35570 RepID=A0A1I8P228_STOCA
MSQINLQPEQNVSKPRSLPIAAGGIVFLSAGMNLAMSFGWFHDTVSYSEKHFTCSWFIGVMIGTYLSIDPLKCLAKKFIMALSVLLILIEGILFTTASDNDDAILGGRYLNGIAIGLATVQYLINAGEISAASNRGHCLAMEQYSLSFGVMIQLVYSSVWDNSESISIICLHGIIDIILALMAAILMIHFVESPIYYIQKGDDASALESLACLQKPPGITMEVQARFEEHKAMVREQNIFTMRQIFRQGQIPLLKMIFCRSMTVAFCFSLPLNAALLTSMDFMESSWPLTAFGCARVIGASISINLMDKIQRKLPSILSAMFVGAFLITLGALFWFEENYLNPNYMNAAISVCIALQAFVGFFTPYTSVFMGEAFPLRGKPYLMAACINLEQIFQIILIETWNFEHLALNLLIQGLLVIMGFAFLSLTLPETRRTSLAEAHRRFWKLVPK